MTIQTEQSTLTIEKLKEMVEMLKPFRIESREPWQDIYFPKIDFPKQEAPQLRYEMLWGCPIIDPRKTAIIHAGMCLEIPDSRPTPLRWTLRFQGYRAYAKVKRQRRETCFKK